MPRKLKITVPVPPLSPADLQAEQQILADLKVLTARLQQRNLDNAVALAQQAARGVGPLVDHFAEIGRRYGRTLNKPATPKLRLVD